MRCGRSRSSKSRIAGVGLAGVLLVGGCVAGPDYIAPEPDVPEVFASAGAGSATHPAVVGAWWTTFEDPLLDRLMEEAIRSNPDLRAARARVLEARALRGGAAADRWPAADAFAGYSRQRRSANAADVGEPFAGDLGSFGIDRDADLFQAGFDAAWEIDLFGHVRRQVEAADADLAAAVEDRRDVLVTVTGEVARTYFELRGLQLRLRVARDALAAQRRTVEILASRVRAGVQRGGERDYNQALAQTRATEAQIPAFEAAGRRAAHRLAVLCGRAPDAFYAELAEARELPPAPPEVPAGLPSELLRRRPDVRRAERRLAAATARIGVAAADLYPRFSLTGTVGLQSERAGDLASVGDSAFWSFGPSVSWRVLDFGRARSAIRAADARQRQALARYEGSILAALEDVENALVTYARERERHRALAEAVAASRRAEALADDLFTQGLSDFLPVLEAQRSRLVNEDQLAESRAALAISLVALHKALGGGWQTSAAAPATQPRP